MRFSIVTLVALLTIVAGGCERRESAPSTKSAPALDPETIWVQGLKYSFQAEIRTAPDGEPVRAHCLKCEPSEDAPVMVFALTATWREQRSGDAVAGMWETSDWRAYRETGNERETDTGRWREFRRLEGEAAGAEIEAAFPRKRDER